MIGNKHFIVAMLVTPVLAILAWFAVGAFVGEKPQQAQPGQSYPLVEGSNCRYDSGQCDLRNEDLRLSITLEDGASQPGLLLKANHKLDGVLLAVAIEGVSADAASPAAMLRQDSAGQNWTLSLERIPEPGQRLRLVVTSDGSNWFAETSTAFLDRYREASGSD